MLPHHSLLIQDFTLSHKKALQQKALRADQPVYSQPNLAITLYHRLVAANINCMKELTAEKALPLKFPATSPS